MKSRRSGFKFIDRQFRETLLFIPGWGLDHRIFAKLDLDYNYLLSILPRPSDFIGEAKSAIDRLKIGKISILGHSMGGFLATDFATRYPETIDALILIGIRKRYESDVLNEVRGHIDKGRSAFMYKMYDQSFSSSEKEGLSYLKTNLLKSYIDEMDEEILDEGLDYLAMAEITSERLRPFNVRIVHGEEDTVAPIGEAAAIAAELPHAKFDRIKGGGHILLLRKDINSILSRR